MTSSHLIPYIYTRRYVQWDDWQWTNPETGKNMDIPGIVDFPPNKQAVPDGLTDWLGMPTSLYAPMWSANNSYRDQYRWIADTDVGTDAGAAIPVDIDFYRDVFKNGSHAQMKMFEQDFLCYYGWLTNLTNSDVSAGMEWLHALNAAAAEANITVQLCMMQPTHALASTELTVVTNGRGTSDNSHGGAADLYALGTSGMLLGAMGLWSSRDNVFTSAIEPGCVGSSNKSNCTSPDFRLQNVAAVLSGGPYGPSDGIGYFNVELIARSCRSDGVLLKSDAPLAVTDFAYATTFDNPHDSLHVWASYSNVDYVAQQKAVGAGNGSVGTNASSVLRWIYLLSVNILASIEVSLAELDATPGTDYMVLDFWGNNGSTPTATSLQRVSAKDRGGMAYIPMSPPQAPVKGGSDAGTYQIVAPIMNSGWCLLGEAQKIVPASRRRFLSVAEGSAAAPSSTSWALEMVVLLANDEAIELWLLPPASTQAEVDTPSAPFKLVQATCPPQKCVGVDCDVQVKISCGKGGGVDCICTAV